MNEKGNFIKKGFILALIIALVFMSLNLASYFIFKFCTTGGSIRCSNEIIRFLAIFIFFPHFLSFLLCGVEGASESCMNLIAIIIILIQSIILGWIIFCIYWIIKKIKLNRSWSDFSYWEKGGIIGVLIGFICFIITTCIWLFKNVKYLDSFSILFFLIPSFLFEILISFFLGIFIGFIIGKIKSRKENI